MKVKIKLSQGILVKLYTVLLILGMILVSNNVEAAINSGGFSSGNVTYSVVSGSRTIADTAIAQWKNVSSKVTISSPSPYNSRVIQTRFDSHQAPTYGDLGVAQYYNGTTRVNNTQRWNRAVVYQYKSSLLNTTIKKTATATHEVGHALSVAHAPKDSTAIMLQGVKTSYKLTSWDKNSLIQKWGR